MQAAQVIADFIAKQSGADGKIDILPGLPTEELAGIANVHGLGKAQFQELVELLCLSRGINLGHELDFTGLIGKAESYDLGSPHDLVSNAVDLGTDRCGNKWVAEIRHGRIAHVLFLCHDPATIVFEASSLGEFLARALHLAGDGKPGIGSDDRSWYREDGGGRVDGDSIWFDLRDRQPGRSVPLSLYYDHQDDLRRHGPELLFSLPRRVRSRWQRFRDRWR